MSVEKDLGRSIGNPRALTVRTQIPLGGLVPIPDELRQDTESSGDTKQDGVEVHFLQAVMVQQDSGMGVDVGVWVLDFSEFVEDVGGESVHLRHEFEQFIIREMFQCKFPTNQCEPPGSSTVEPCIEDPSFEAQHVRIQERLYHSSK